MWPVLTTNPGWCSPGTYVCIQSYNLLFERLVSYGVCVWFLALRDL